MDSYKILIIDDDQKLVEYVKEYLEKEFYQVITAYNGLEGLEKVNLANPDLVILDLMLPQLDGLEVCRQLRKESSLPILMLTAKGDETDKVVGLELGADDYLTKPFSLKELVARIRAILRRVSKTKNVKKIPEKILKFKSFTIDLEKREVLVEKQPVELTATEFKLLKLLATHPGVVFSRGRLLDAIRGKDYMPFDRSVDIHISHLRQKIEKETKSLKYIKTVWGVGYKFQEIK